MKAVFHSRHAIGEMSFSQGWLLREAKWIEKNKIVASDLEEHISDSDEANKDVFIEDVQFIGGEKSISF